MVNQGEVSGLTGLFYFISFAFGPGHHNSLRQLLWARLSTVC